MNLLDLMVKIGVDDQASAKVDAVGSRIVGGLGGAAKAGATAIAGAMAAAGAATLAIGKSALDSYASYEQLAGGVETLFKGAAGTLEGFANRAYATAGVSANAYMEQATSFAASLVSSLGNDYAAAAKYADMAITDMSDNANKMGTDLGSLQYAYQGFAKQNYSMLDNLKLGYGGTQEEMKRLVEHANEVKEANGEMADLSMDSFADVVEAIHTVQEEMGIAGTTSKEAATTIEGSVGMMKAAWDNWLAGLGKSEADMGELTEQLASSLASVAENVIPRLGEIFGTLFGQIPAIAAEAGPGIADALTQAVQQGAANLYEQLPPQMQQTWDAVVAGVESSGLAEAFDGAVGSVCDAAQGAADAVKRLAGAFDGVSAAEGAASALELFGGFVQDVSDQAGEYLVPAVENLQEQFGNLCNAFSDAQTWLQPLAEMIGNILVAAVIFLVDALTLVVGVVTSVIDGITWLVGAVQSAPEAFSQFVAGVGEWLSQLPGMIWEWLTGAVDSAVQWVSSMVEQAGAAGSGFVSSVGGFVSSLPGMFWGWLTGVISSVASWVGSMASNAASAGSQFVSNVAGFIQSLPGRFASWLQSVIGRVVGWASSMGSQATSAASTFASNLISGIQSLPGRVASIGSNIVSSLANAIRNAAGAVASALRSVVDGAISAAKSALGIASPSKVFKAIGRYTMQGLQLGIEQNSSLPVRAMASAVEGVESVAAMSVQAAPVRGGGSEAVEWLSENLPRIIERHTPVMGYDDFGRMTRKAVAYAR